jgi:ubiquinone/menaquinone biosynthesis C-methylase UbiE
MNLHGPSGDVSPYDAWARYYDIMDVDRTPYIAFYCSLVSERTRTVLELGCGTGTITLALADALRNRRPSTPARVVGIDCSTGMLDIARSRSTACAWVLGDIRRPSVTGPFDLIVCCFNTLQLLKTNDDVEAALSAARRLLGGDGRFAFDIYQPNVSYLTSPYTNRLARAISTPDGRRLEIREDAEYDSVTRILTLDWRLVQITPPASAPLAATRYLLRQYFRPDVDRLLSRAGLKPVEEYGDFDGSPFTAASKKQILVCRAS